MAAFKQVYVVYLTKSINEIGYRRTDSEVYGIFQSKDDADFASKTLNTYYTKTYDGKTAATSFVIKTTIN